MLTVFRYSREAPLTQQADTMTYCHAVVLMSQPQAQPD